jgi:hypothetical protein
MRHAIRAGIAGTLLALTSGVAIAEQPTLTVRAADQAVATEIADRLGAALATPARADSGAACAVRCLDIDLDVEARHATVRWLAADGVTHERALALGPFQAVWAADLALLAENLIRDQTADILASLAPAPIAGGRSGRARRAAAARGDPAAAPRRAATSPRARRRPGPVCLHRPGRRRRGGAHRIARSGRRAVRRLAGPGRWLAWSMSSAARRTGRSWLARSRSPSACADSRWPAPRPSAATCAACSSRVA